MSQFDLTEDQLQIQEMARKFTADAITPCAAEWDEKHIFPRDTIREAAELGFGAIYVPEETGGIGLGRLADRIPRKDMLLVPLRRERGDCVGGEFCRHLPDLELVLGQVELAHCAGALGRHAGVSKTG